MPASSKIGSNRPLTFLHNGKPTRPYKPRPVDKSASAKGIALAGKSSFGELNNKLRSMNSLSPEQIGRSAVQLQKAAGISINTTI